MLELLAGRRPKGCGENPLGQDDRRAGTIAIERMRTFADASEAVAGRDDPSIISRTAAVFPEIFEDGRIRGTDVGKVIKRLVGAGGERGGSNIVTEDAAINDLREKRSPRQKTVQQVGDVLLTIRHERFLVARAATERDHNDFAVRRRGLRKQWAGGEKRCAGSGAQKFPTAFRYAATRHELTAILYRPPAKANFLDSYPLATHQPVALTSGNPL